MDCNKLTVQVEGGPMTGKSTVARTIELALRNVGFDVKRLDNNGRFLDDGSPLINELPGEVELTVDERVKTLVERGVQIRVQTSMKFN